MKKNKPIQHSTPEIEPGSFIGGFSGSSDKNPFVVPPGYFDSLSSEVIKKIEALPDFEAGSSENAFSVPSGYFDSLPEQIRGRIHGRRVWYDSAMEWILRPAPRVAFAIASFALLMLFSIAYFTRTVHVEYASHKTGAEQFYESVLAQVDESVLSEVYAEEVVFVGTDAANELENYLLENDVDLNSISEHL